jgi:hypothetical protein
MVERIEVLQDSAAESDGIGQSGAAGERPPHY